MKQKMKGLLHKALLLGGGLLAVAAGSSFYLVRRELTKLESTDPRVWESDIRTFEQEDRKTPPPQGAVLFVGSSSIRFWFGLPGAMHPLPVIRRGFGGAKLSDVLYYAHRIVLPYRPRAIVLFAGTNDIRGGAHDKTPVQLLDDLKMLVSLVEEQLPGTPLYYVSITPTTSRWQVWPQIQQANRLIAQYARNQPNVHFIDATPLLLTRGGLPNRDMLWWDGVHLNRKGYRQWGHLIRSRLMKDLYEPASPRPVVAEHQTTQE